MQERGWRRHDAAHDATTTLQEIQEMQEIQDGGWRRHDAAHDATGDTGARVYRATGGVGVWGGAPTQKTRGASAPLQSANQRISQSAGRRLSRRPDTPWRG